MTTATSIRRLAIFGATSGIAKSVARHYAERGTALVLVGRDLGALEAEAADLRVRGAGRVEVLQADFADTDSMARVADRSWEALDGLDAALVAYGSLPDQAGCQADPGLARDALALNFVSPALLLGELANRFEVAGSGVLAAISSVAGNRGRQSNYVYGAAKGGLQRFLEGLRHRLSRAGVAVLDIRPGFVSTPMTAHLPRTGPLWAEPDKVAADIASALEGRRAVLYTPWFWRLILLIVRGLPRAVFHRTQL